MSSTSNIKSPITINKGYGTTGMNLHLSLAQMQSLGSVYANLQIRSEDLSIEESLLLPFLKIFKDYSLNNETIWSNFKEEEEMIPNMQA